MGKKLLSLLCVLAVVLSLGAVAFASNETATTAASGEASGRESSEAAAAPVDRPEPEVVEGERYVSDYLDGASAVYVSGEEKTFDDAYFYGAGFASSDEINAQIPNQYGMCSVVLAAGQGTEVTLNNPTIQSDPQSYSNGVFAAAMAKVTINGGSIDTNNSSGHGIDTTYMGHVYAYDTVIHTQGETSGGLASDFGGGFIQGERLDVTTDGRSSPAVFCAGTTIIMLKDSKLTTTKATGIVVAHDHSVVVLDNCDLNAEGTAVSGLQALPSPEASEGSVFYAFGGKLASETGAVIGESGGRTVVNLIGTECVTNGYSVINSSKGILTVNLWDTELEGHIECAEGASLTINIYDGGKLTGEVSGNVELNVYDGGEYVGSYKATQAGKGEDAPVMGSFDDYLVNYWGTGSLTWTQARVDAYTGSIEPQILANSAASYAAKGTASIVYDPETYDPSENGVDLSLLNVGGAHGFTMAEVFGGAESRTPFASGEASGKASGDASASQVTSDADQSPDTASD